jgi:hypothetical protein
VFGIEVFGIEIFETELNQEEHYSNPRKGVGRYEQ